MKKYVCKLSLVTSLSVALLIAACGGGGGSAGAVTGTSGASTAVVVSSTAPKPPGLTVSLLDQAGAVTPYVGSSGLMTVKVLLADPSGNPLSGQLVSVSSSSTNVLFPVGTSAITNSAGVANVSVSRASLTAVGSGAITATYDYKVGGSLTAYPDGSALLAADTLINKSLVYSLTTPNITLSSLSSGLVGNLAAYGTAKITVTANIDGLAATASPVQVSFVSNCGVVTPSTVTTNSSGVAETSFTAVNSSDPNDQGCSNSAVKVTASTPGATPVPITINVDLAPATNLLFVDASPSLIYLSNSGGVTQSVVRFRVVNDRSKPMQGQSVILKLKDLVSITPPRVSFGTTGNTADITLQSDADGEVKVPVFSGTIPTSAVVSAALVSDPTIKTTSSVLAVASGRAVQSRASLSATLLSVEAFNVDNVATDLNLILTDRQGNAVPDGTTVNFVSEQGLVQPATCTTLLSRCKSTLYSSGPRPADGLVTVLAYAPGEEDFVDANFDNQYSSGETFTDLGNAYLDTQANSLTVNGTYVAGYFSVPKAGSTTCTGGYMGRPDSCDGVWGSADVRKHIFVVWATGTPKFASVSISSGGFSAILSDLNNNSLPTGSTITPTALDKTTANTKACTAGAPSYSKVPNQTGSIVLSVELTDCVPGDGVSINVTTPAGTSNSTTFYIP
ncbi:MAG: hypothetical protein RL392_2144 [Pseudomonadota bacterium]|jgi:hypothetical protein